MWVINTSTILKVLTSYRVWSGPSKTGGSRCNRNLSLMSKPTYRVRQFMSLIGLLTVTEKTVPLGQLHMRPIHWHLKNLWRVNESMEKEIQFPDLCTLNSSSVPRKQTSFWVNCCTTFSMPFRSLQMPEMKAGVLT